MKVLLRNLFVFCALALGLIGFTGCETLQEQNDASASAPQPRPTDGGERSDIIRVGEQLTIEFFETNLGKIEQVVADDGTITLPLLPERVPAGGKKVSELQDALHKLYVPRYFHRMTVNIKRENRFYWVRGEVKRPGQLTYTGEMTVTKAISAAGDFTEYANRSKIEVIRGNGVKTKVKWNDALKNPAKYDLPIYPGDTVHVPQSIY
ncbi:MAG TPA: polysaccharide biosynthesis/export family protein [Verrucomicrobiae bacterium]|nr:polysaccharide biosynthesis/export family protein [Verrucomicrobiae bacterium]